jgi:HD-like signal output (HDOD) protein/CheY-like chemotaxis protein
MTKRILFVDDEPHALQALRRLLHPLRVEWEMCFAFGAAQALEQLRRLRFDVLVADLRMPEMSGGELLERVRDEHPSVVRIILSGHADERLSLESVCTAHQYLSKPCDPRKLRETIQRACALRALLDDGALKTLVSGMGTLPSIPAAYGAIMEELRVDEPSIARVGEIIARDPAMTAKLLQLVNSAFFGLGHAIVDPVQGVNFLGLATVSSLALSAQVFARFDPTKLPGFRVDALWEHSLAVAALSRDIAATVTDDPATHDNAYLAGLLHDVGELVLADGTPGTYGLVLERARREGLSGHVPELEDLGTTHATVGGYLLGLWGLADAVVEGVAYHHSPSSCPTKTFRPLTAVHVADALCGATQVDVAHLERLGLTGRLGGWEARAEALRSISQA